MKVIAELAEKANRRMFEYRNWLDGNGMALSIFEEALKDFKSESRQEIFDNIQDLPIKGDLIAGGCCVDFAHFLVDRLLEKINPDRIKIYEWGYIHIVVTVDDDVILDAASYPVKFSRNKLNEIFLSQVASLAVTLNEHYYIVSGNGVSIIYDPWGFVDNQDFNHDEYNLIPSKETVYTVEEFKRMRRKDD